ncbi:MAG: CRISPR-associated helicase Cas3' [Propionibacteriaceae bacterium]|nr:CRISPR-associated helicase Cas3' [Propionibacteriaceae bacterium]
MSVLDNPEPELTFLWAKSDAAGRSHSLPGHLIDSVAVAELIWDQFLARSVTKTLDGIADGRGRDLFRLLCGWHDVGKCSPAFVTKDRKLAQIARAGGIPLSSLVMGKIPQQWHHTHAGRRIIEEYLKSLGLLEHAWLAVIIEGHHGKFLGRNISTEGHGKPTWFPLQRRLCEWVETEIGVRLADLVLTAPNLAVQLVLSGYVVMADWIASSDFFEGTELQAVSLPEARKRAEQAWNNLGLGTVSWDWNTCEWPSDPFKQRFGINSRPFQDSVVTAAQKMEKPGLLLIEAPMGEGKTEAALVAAEVLARRFECNGLLFAMPTQGTTDAMYERCQKWAAAMDVNRVFSLVHGKAMLNETWRSTLENRRMGDVYGMDDDPYGVNSSNQHGGALEWILGRHRALLAPAVVATIDHLLFAGTKTKFVMLRHSGLVGKVVIIDEVHCYDVFIMSFLHEVLQWLSEAGVPVILMSATLPPVQREALLKAYSGHNHSEVAMDTTGYPLLSVASRSSDAVDIFVAQQWRPDIEVKIKVLDGADTGVLPVVSQIAADLEEGGCALAIMNTVKRATTLAKSLREAGLEVLLLHGRLTARERAVRTERAIDLLSKERTLGAGRPKRLVVVATQIAEQSFDVDADILYTDIAPIDLLLQRIGRLHRHNRPVTDRPNALKNPRVVVCGLSLGSDGCKYPTEFEYVYDSWSLLRAASLISDADIWQIPGDVPDLVVAGYTVGGPVQNGWESAETTAYENYLKASNERKAYADSFLLRSGSAPDASDLSEFHHAATSSADDEAVVVRDGEPTMEVSLVIRTEDGYETLGGRSLGPNGERCSSIDIAREVLADSVRVKELREFLQLRSLSAWETSTYLRSQRALILEADGIWECDKSRFTLRYDKEYGLAIEWKDTKQ